MITSDNQVHLEGRRELFQVSLLMSLNASLYNSKKLPIPNPQRVTKGVLGAGGGSWAFQERWFWSKIPIWLLVFVTSKFEAKMCQTFEEMFWSYRERSKTQYAISTQTHGLHGRPSLEDVKRQFWNGSLCKLKNSAKITRCAQRDLEEKRNTTL